MFKQITPKNFQRLMDSGVLKKGNYERCARVFYDAIKIVHYRQERLNKPQLKMTEISSALILADFYHSLMFRFVASGDLACNFGGPYSEDKAIAYFGNSVVGTIADVHGRKVEITDDGALSLYKEKHTGKHRMAPENYEATRGKRLPWIRHVLTAAPSIFQAEGIYGRGGFQRRYLYTSIATIPLSDGAVNSYFVVVVAEKANGLLRFLTAYAVDRHNGFLKIIEESFPFKGR